MGRGGGGHGEQKEKQVEIQRTKGKKRGESDGEKREIRSKNKRHYTINSLAKGFLRSGPHP